MGMFDDLVPQQGRQAGGSAPAAAGRGMFDDLVPQQSAPAAAPQVESDLYNTFMSPLRGFNKGLADMASSPYRAIDWAAEKITGGDGLPDVETMPAWQHYREPVEAQTTAGRYLQKGGEAVGSSVLPEAGLLMAAPRMAAASAKTVGGALAKGLGQPFVAAPGRTVAMDMSGAAAAGASGEAAKDAGYGETGQFVASLAGGVAGAGIPGAVDLARRFPATMRAVGSHPQAQRINALSQDMKDLNIDEFGPALATARRDDTSGGRLANWAMSKPFISRPLLNGRSRFLDQMAREAKNIQDEYGQVLDPAALGARVRESVGQFNRQTADDILAQSGHGLDPAELGASINRRLEEFNTRTIADPRDLNMDDLRRIADMDPREMSLPDVQAARYELSDRALPEGALTGRPTVGEERMMMPLTQTMGALRDIKAREGRKMNVSEAVRDAQGRNPELNDLRGYENPRWTNSSTINRSMDAVVSAGGRWRTGIEGVRGIRSDVRRAGAAVSDQQPAALLKGDIEHLEGTVTTDMLRGFEQAAERADAIAAVAQRAGREQDALAAQVRAGRYRAAAMAYRQADDLTREYKTYLEEARNGLTNLRTDESLGRGVIRAMQRDGGNIAGLRALYRVLPDADQQRIAASAIGELGRAGKDGGFSRWRLVEGLRAMNPEARELVFGRDPRLRQMLDEVDAFHDPEVAAAEKAFFAPGKAEATSAHIMTAMKREGGNIAALRALVRVLPEQDMDQLAATVLAEMGRPRNSAGAALREAGFSPAEAIANWTGFSDEAKQLVFGRNPRLRLTLDKLIRVARSSKEFENLKNSSGTGFDVAITGAVTVGGVGLAQLSPTMAIGAAGTWMLGRGLSAYLASPVYVRWLSRALDSAPSKAGQALNELAGIAMRDANLDPAARQALLALLRQMLGDGAQVTQ